MLEKTLESPLECKKIKPVNPKGNQSLIFIERIDAEAEAPILWPPAVKSWLIGKDPDAGKDWGQEKRATEDEMVGWHHWLNGHESKQGKTGKPGVLQSMGSWRVGCDWAMEQQQLASLEYGFSKSYMLNKCIWEPRNIFPRHHLHTLDTLCISLQQVPMLLACYLNFSLASSRPSTSCLQLVSPFCATYVAFVILHYPHPHFLFAPVWIFS